MVDQGEGIFPHFQGATNKSFKEILKMLDEISVEEKRKVVLRTNEEGMKYFDDLMKKRVNN